MKWVVFLKIAMIRVNTTFLSKEHVKWLTILVPSFSFCPASLNNPSSLLHFVLSVLILVYNLIYDLLFYTTLF